MIDLKFIRENPEKIKKVLVRKNFPVEKIDEFLLLDKKNRENLVQIEDLSAKQNEFSKKIPQLQGAEKNKVLVKMKTVSDEKKELEKEAGKIRENLNTLWKSIPNPPDDSAPDGKTDEENLEIKKWGEIREFKFKPKEHWELAEKLDILDTKRSAKVSGSRFYYMKNELAILQRALIFWAFMEVQKKFKFSPMIPPFLTKKEAVVGTGFFDHNENYCVNAGNDELFLIGTSEVSMTSYFADEILDCQKMPYKFVSYSPCFRKEAGSYGKDTKGIFRVHQFEKIEMVAFCEPQDSPKIHEEIREIEEHILQSLKIPYRLVNVCTGDLGISATKKYDLEAWLPGQNQYREMTSTSICTDWQARRLNIRIKNKDGKNIMAHTLNGTAVSSRPLVAILENFQNADGSIDIPKVLQPFCGFEKITVK